MWLIQEIFESSWSLAQVVSHWNSLHIMTILLEYVNHLFFISRINHILKQHNLVISCPIHMIQGQYMA